MSDIKPIRDEAGYNAYLDEIRKLWAAEQGTPNGDRLDVLMTLVEAYEAENHVIEPPDPIEAIRIRMNDLGLNRHEMCRMLSIETGRLSEILNRKRRLSVDMMRTLARELGLSEKCLLTPYELQHTSRSTAPRRALAHA